jgi:hypothetical protein
LSATQPPPSNNLSHSPTLVGANRLQWQQRSHPTDPVAPLAIPLTAQTEHNRQPACPDKADTASFPLRCPHSRQHRSTNPDKGRIGLNPLSRASYLRRVRPPHRWTTPSRLFPVTVSVGAKQARCWAWRVTPSYVLSAALYLIG